MHHYAGYLASKPVGAIKFNNETSIFLLFLFFILFYFFNFIFKLYIIVLVLPNKKNTFDSVLMRLMKLETIIQSEVSQKEKHQYSILTHIYGI